MRVTTNIYPEHIHNIYARVRLLFKSARHMRYIQSERYDGVMRDDIESGAAARGV